MHMEMQARSERKELWQEAYTCRSWGSNKVSVGGSSGGEQEIGNTEAWEGVGTTAQSKNDVNTT